MRRPAWVLALLLLVLPFGANALGLGDIELLSALNEPLDARISLRAVKEGDLDDLQIRIASKDHFARAGIERAFVLTSLKFSAQEGAAPGTGEIRISTREPMTEPFLNFLLDVDWRQGRVIREYTVLLDPPVYGAAISTTVEEAVTTVEALPELDEPVAEPEVITSTTGTTSTATTTSSGATPGTYGPVKSTDTAWSLAEHLRPSSSVTVQQTMLALLSANPNAFARGNINALQQGAVLRVPHSSEINALSASEALSEVKRQHALWEEYRQSASASTTQQPAGEAESSAAAADSGESTSTSGTASSAEDDSSRLDIVSAGSGEVGAGGSSEDVAALQNELSTALEEADIERRENEEMRDRLAEADVIISQLQRAVEIKDDDIAALQDELAKTEAELEAAKSVTMEAEPEPAPEPEPEPVPEPEPKPTTFMDVVASFVPLDNPIVLAAAGGGVLLVIILIVVFAKRRRSASLDDLDVPDEALELDDDAATEIPMEEDATQLPPMGEEEADLDPFDTDEDATQLPPAMADTEAPPVEEETESEEEDDPLEGLNIYLAYEDYDNATKLVKDVIGKHPERHEYKARLLEIYYASKNIPAFETTAKELQDAVGEDSPMMDSARRWWDDLSPGRGLFEAPPAPSEGSFDETHIGTGGEEAIFDVTDSSGAAFGADDTMEISLDDVEADGDGGGVDFDLGFEFESAEAEETELPSPEEGHTLDFEVGAEDAVQTPPEAEDSGVDFDLETEAEPTELPDPDSLLDDDTVDFELDVGAEAEPAGEEGIGLDIEIPSEDTVTPDEPAAEDGLDIELDFDDVAEADPTELPPPAEEGIDFDLDVEPQDSITDAEEGLDIALDLDSETDDSPLEDAASPEPETAAELDIEIPGDETTDLTALEAEEGLDFALDEPESVTEQTEGDSEDLDFSLDIDTPAAETATGQDVASVDEGGLDLGALEDESPTDAGADDLDFALDLDTEEEEVTESEPAEDDLAEEDLAEDDLDFALDIDTTEDSAVEAESVDQEADDSLDFGLDVDETDDTPVKPEPAAEVPDGDLGFELDIEDADATDLDADQDTDELDFALDIDADAGEEAGNIPELKTETETGESQPAGESDELDFALDLDTSSEPEPVGEEASEDGLDFALDLDESADSSADQESMDAESTQYMLRDAPEVPEVSSEDEDVQAPETGPDDAGDTVFMIDQPAGDDGGDETIDITLEPDPEVEIAGSDAPAESDDDGLDFALDMGEESSDVSSLEDTSFIMDDTVSAQDLDAALDISLDLDEPGTESGDDQNLDLGGDLEGEATVIAADGGDDMPTLDFDLDDPMESEPAPDFETVQLKAEDLARAGAIEPDAAGTLDEGDDGVEVDSDFADIFGGGLEGDDEVPELDIELPDSALTAEEADVANVEEIDFDLGEDDGESPVPGDSDYERTQYMLRDIANMTSDEDDDDDEEDKTLVLGRSGGEVDEMQTKLDLAQAYIDMGDTEGARNILGEVMAEGSDAQQDLARQLLSQLN